MGGGSREMRKAEGLWIKLTSKRSASPMHLQLRKLSPTQAPSLQGLSDDALLGRAIRSSQAAAAPILIHCTP